MLWGTRPPASQSILRGNRENICGTRFHKSVAHWWHPLAARWHHLDSLAYYYEDCRRELVGFTCYLFVLRVFFLSSLNINHSWTTCVLVVFRYQMYKFKCVIQAQLITVLRKVGLIKIFFLFWALRKKAWVSNGSIFSVTQFWASILYFYTCGNLVNFLATIFWTRQMGQETEDSLSLELILQHSLSLKWIGMIRKAYSHCELGSTPEELE